jgi:ketosteroid isomerase-like protein
LNRVALLTVIIFFDAMRDGRVVRASAFFDSVEFNDFWRRVVPDASK